MKLQKPSQQLEVMRFRTPLARREEIHSIVSSIKPQVSESGTKGDDVGISGGIDSAVAAAISTRALSRRRIVAVYLFEDRSHNSLDFLDAKQIAKQLGIKLDQDFRLTNLVEAFLRILDTNHFKMSKLTLANVKARFRMVILYALSNDRNLLVAGMRDRSESLLGYFTKYSDIGADILPIGHLYKTEVRALGSELKLAFRIVTKPFRPNLWPGHSTVEELQDDYEVRGSFLTLLYDSKKNPQEISSQTGVSKGVMRVGIKMSERRSHKRELPPIPRIESYQRDFE